MLFIRLSSNINHRVLSFRPLIGIHEHMVQFLRLKQRFEWTKSPFPYYFHGLILSNIYFLIKYIVYMYTHIFYFFENIWLPTSKMDDRLFKAWSICSPDQKLQALSSCCNAFAVYLCKCSFYQGQPFERIKYIQLIRKGTLWSRNKFTQMSKFSLESRNVFSKGTGTEFWTLYQF